MFFDGGVSGIEPCKLDVYEMLALDLSFDSVDDPKFQPPHSRRAPMKLIACNADLVVCLVLTLGLVRAFRK